MVAQHQLPTAESAVVQYWPRGASAELFRHHEPEVVLSGPAGTGKTFGCLWRLHLAALKYPGMRALMVRKTQEDLTASAVVTYRERVLASGEWGVQPFGGSRFKPAAFIYPNGSMLMVGGLDKADKVMSRDYDLVYVNEAWEIDEDAWQKLTTRVNRPGKVMPYNQVFGDTNPQGPGHWIYKRCHQAKKTTMLWSKHEDNPELWDAAAQEWTEDGLAYLATLANLSGHLRDRLLEGRWVAADGAVYPLFDRQTHVKRVDCDGWATILGLDVGTRNPTALGTIRFAGDRIHVEREVYQSGLGTDEIVDAVAEEYERSGALYVVVDPSAAGIIVSLQKRGVKCRKATNDVQEGIRAVTSALPDLTIDPSCEHTIDEHEGYHYPAKKTETERDAPVKADDHTCDMLRYVVVDLAKPKRKVFFA
jgi:PBSX family phage terminase large subunit